MKQTLSDSGIQPTACGRDSYCTLGGRERLRPRRGAPATTALLVGCDSAWTPTNSGSLVGVLQFEDRTYRELGPPRIVNYREAEGVILEWQAEHVPTATIVLLDQPTIVGNAAGQRPVENLVASPVSRRYGGMQPANTARKEMFGEEAPVWRFLARFGGPADPLAPVADTRVFETYPVLAMIALGWTLPDSRPAGRLPKYNPERRKTFSISDWQHVCGLASAVFRARGLVGIAQWIDDAGQNHVATQARSGPPGCLLVLGGRAVLGRADRLSDGRRSSDWLHHRAVRHRASRGTRSPLQADWSSAVGVGANIPGAGERAVTVDIAEGPRPNPSGGE